VVSLWNIAVELEPDGDFSDWTDEELNDEIGMGDRRKNVAQALVTCRLLGGDRQVNGWWEYQGSHREAVEKAKYRKRKREEGGVSGDSPETVPGLSATTGQTGQTGQDIKTPSATPSGENHSTDIETVRLYYRRHHSLRLPKIQSNSKEARLLRAAFKGGYMVESICRAIEGNMTDAWHQGGNKDKKKYDGLALIVRDSEHIDKFMEYVDDATWKETWETWTKQRQPTA
jgi:hypothetical protein